MNKQLEYIEFLQNKIVYAKKNGFKINVSDINSILMPHQKDIVEWCLSGGRRAIFASFGLGKTVMQLEVAQQLINKTNQPFLICMPLGVVGEFRDDLDLLGYTQLEYITDTSKIETYENKVYVTNYERVRKGDIDPNMFCGVSFDEASILRNLKTQTTNFVLQYFKQIQYRFVATATPTPNDFIEILNYADFLGVIDRGHALTRFFQRDSTKAGNLTLYPNKKDEFWKWVATWAVFINKPSDLGYDDIGYDLPMLNLIEIEVQNSQDGEVIQNKKGDIVIFKDTTKGLIDTSREKKQSIPLRCAKVLEIFEQNKEEKFILWHHREEERQTLERLFKDHFSQDVDSLFSDKFKSVFGSQKNQEKEQILTSFKRGEFQLLATKPQIAGSGCNFQSNCNNMVFVGIDYKFNDFIQAVHRCYRFKQEKEVNVYVIHTQNERHVLKTLKEKWRKHIELQTEMINIVREYGLNDDKIKADMKRQIFKNRQSHKIGNAKVFNEDTVLIHKEMESESTDMILTSIPFGDHYEYSDNYNDFGHNHGNDKFFEQMDYLIPDLYRTLKSGRIAAIHVKDRIRYSYQNGTSFTTIKDFSGETVRSFEKHGFFLIGKITVTTDVVRENNQTYRLGWSEQCKDGSKMGVGLPEYILLFRKPPSESNNAYADEPVMKTKEEYTRANWQLDAHAYWRSDGNRFLSSYDLKSSQMKSVFNWWKKFNEKEVYSFQEHLNTCEELEENGKLSALFMTLPTISNNELVWSDINRMNTLNAKQTNRKKEKHICPLQLDIIERLINRYTMKGDLIDDPFGGLFSTAYKALEMGRKAISTELNPEYYNDGLFYLKSIEYKINVPTLFDLQPA